MLIYAHRGLSGRYPENTLRAFREALAANVDGIELDVHITSDGVPVVLHDRDLSRTTNGHGNVDQTPLAVLQTLDAGAGERVPTLAEVLTEVGATVHLDIEIKGPATERPVIDVLSHFSGVRFAISSFDWGTLRTLRRLESSIELWPLAERADDALFDIAADMGSPAVSLWWSAYDAVSATRLREAGLRVVVWTVNDAATAECVRQLGAHALCTDDPARIAPSPRG